MSKRAIEALEELGFSTYEARTYLALLQDSPITGYQLSKRSGVPRSRIYETLERLVVKGYAVALQSEPAEYAPMAVSELVSSLKEEFDGTVNTLEAELARLAAVEQQESIWNLRGRETILRKARVMMAGAQTSLYLVAWAEIIQELRADLEAAAARGLQIVVISCGDIDLPVGAHYRHAFEEHIVCADDSSINLVADGVEVLVGQTQPAESCWAAWSRNVGLVQVTEEYIRHEVYLHKIVERLGEESAAELRAAFVEGLQEIPYRFGTS